MAKFKITPTTTVAELKDQFSKEVGGVLRVYDGRSEATDSATLVSLGAKEGELECRTSRTVGKFEEAFQKDLNLKVKVYTKDNWVKVLDGITLAAAAELPNGMTKAKMEEYLSYQRDEREEEIIEEKNEEREDNITPNIHTEMEDKIKLLEEELNKVLDYDIEKRIKKMFFEAIPDGTYIYSKNSDYETQNVADAIDCAVCDYDANCNRYIKAIQFYIKDNTLMAIECLSDEEDEIWDCEWNVMYMLPANYTVLSRLLEEYEAGNHSDSPVSLIPSCEVEDEEYEDEE